MIEPVLRDLAEKTAREAGALLLRLQAEARRDVRSKSTPTDMVSEVDHESEALIVSRILAARPSDGILGEEGGERPGTSGVRWVIDPLDGTTNYLYGRGDYCVSIAAETPDHTLAGVVYDPTRDEVFSAARGQGATLNGRAIRPSAPSALGTALIGTGFSYEPWIRSEQAALVAQLMPHIRDIRRGGSAALDLCAVSCGRLDGYFETVGPWDKAAGMLILEEAGGQTAHLPLTPGVPDAVVAAGAAVFDALLALLVASRSTRLPHD